MSRIAYQPCSDDHSRRNLKASIHNPVSLEYLSSFMSNSELDILGEKYPSGHVYLWGVTPNVNAMPAWEKLSTGDISLFNIKSVFSIAGVVTQKIRNQRLAVDLWGWKNEEAHETWECIYFIDQITHLAVPYNEAMEGSTSHPRMAFNLLNPANSDIIFDNLALGDKIAGIGDKPNVEEVRREIHDAEVEGQSKTATRKEHRFIVNHLFGDRTEVNCAICGKNYPRSYLVAAHIKKRSRCTLKEKKDVENIATPMCVFGCDSLFENGLISVSDRGTIISHPTKIQNQSIQDYVDKLKGKTCHTINAKNLKYFGWHRREHGFEAM